MIIFNFFKMMLVLFTVDLKYYLSVNFVGINSLQQDLDIS